MPKANRNARRAVILAVLVALSACKGGKPSGQVVAKVDGQEITAAELRLEMAQTPPDQANPSAVQQQALQRIIARKLLAREAERRKIDTTPAAQTAAARARETTLVQILQAKLGDTPLDTSDGAVSKFIDSHPAQFSGRRLIEADQLVVSAGSPELAAQLQGMSDMSAVEAFLKGKNIGFVRSATVLDTAQMPSAGVDRIATLKPDTIVVAPGPGGSLRVAHVGSSRSEPLAGDAARDAALRLMQVEHAQSAQAAIQKILENGKSRVWIDPGLAKS